MLSNLLRGERIRLTALNKKDIPTLVRWEEDTTFLRLFNSNLARPRTEAAIAAWLDEIDKANNELAFAIRLLETNDLIGIVGFDGIAWNNQVAGFSIGIGDQPSWGQGYGFEATQLPLTYAFNELNLHRLQLTVFSYNERAMALYEKCGFKREGVFREYLQRDGKRYDMVLYGLLRHEWEESGKRL